jgi:Uma2 family endonuclease
MVAILNPPETLSEQRTILRNISWQLYEQMLAENQDIRNPRFFYDEGVLEIMTVSAKHEGRSYNLAKIVDVIAEELEINIRGLGSTTFKREDMRKGFEPDECYYIQSLNLIKGKEEIDLYEDPPPDLVIEIDITSPSLPRFPIFAALGVPEVWRYQNEQVQFFRLENGEYVEVVNSIAFPIINSTTATEFLNESLTMESVEWLRGVRNWVRENKG